MPFGDWFSNLKEIFLKLPWMNILMEIWNMVQNLPSSDSHVLYEVLEHQATLELLDQQGKRARFRKYQKVRYLQNDVIAYQDQAWGDGKILLNYRCSPGVPVDFYRPGNKTYILIALRGVRNKGEKDEHHMEWGIMDGFLRKQELWETSVNHPTGWLKIDIIFPQKRPPIRVSLLEDTRQKTTLLGDENLTKLPDERWQVHWETNQVRQHERYSIQWEW